MKTQFETMEQVIRNAEEWNREHAPLDKVTMLPNFRFVPAENGTGTHLSPMGESNPEDLYLSNRALGQLIDKVGYASKVYEVMPAKLNWQNMNWLIQNRERGKVMLRTIDRNQVRAVMGENFATVDHVDLLQALAPVTGGAVVRWHHFDEAVFHLSLSFPQSRFEIKVGDPIEYGIHISNSEVGFRSITIAAYWITLSCLNGMVKRKEGDWFRFRHVGNETKLLEASREAIRTVMLTNEGTIEKFKQALDKEIDSPVDELEAVCKQQNVTQADFKAMLNDVLYNSGEDCSNLYGLTQAVSYSANKLEGEDAFERQQLAVAVLENGLRRR